MPPIFSGDLKLLLQKKIDLLRQWFELAQHQFTTVDTSSLTKVLQQKDSLIEQLQQTDQAIDYWHSEHSRDYNPDEEQLFLGIELAVQDIQNHENRFTTQLQSQIDQISLELQELSQQEQAKRYFKTHSQVGKLLHMKQ